MNDSRQNDGLQQIIVFMLLVIIVLAALVVGGASGSAPVTVAAEPTSAPVVEATIEAVAPTDATPAPVTRVFFAAPADHATLPTTFTVDMGAEGLTVEPAGEIHEHAGHFHILIDTPFIEPGQGIPNDETHLHFGRAQTSAELTLTPGEHVLRLQFADGAHIALEGEQYRDEITVTVE